MILQDLKARFESEFDLVGYINTSTYDQAAQKLGLKEIEKADQTLFVLGYAYPKRIIKQSHTHLVPSFYTFGRDYHLVLKNKIEHICAHLDLEYEYGVDNHPLDERLMAHLAGLGFMGKNQLMINEKLGSYFFLAYAIINTIPPKPYIHQITDSCGDCHQCIDACPTHALSESGYEISKCISYYNQEKISLSHDQIKANYQLFGCDICQLACPKNMGKGQITHQEFKLSGKEKVSIKDLFHDSQKVFNQKYKDMAYLWKGKTLLMRNAAILLLNQQNTSYMNELELSLDKHKMPWYQTSLKTVINGLKKIESQ